MPGLRRRVQNRPGCGSDRFFLPIADPEELEAQYLFFVESWEGFPYSEFMKLPSTLRHRLINKKVELEKERKMRMEAASRRR